MWQVRPPGSRPEKLRQYRLHLGAGVHGPDSSPPRGSATAGSCIAAAPSSSRWTTLLLCDLASLQRLIEPFPRSSQPILRLDAIQLPPILLDRMCIRWLPAIAGAVHAARQGHGPSRVRVPGPRVGLVGHGDSPLRRFTSDLRGVVREDFGPLDCRPRECGALHQPRLSVGTRSNLPFPLMAVLSATPALGLATWLSLRVRQQYAALILGAMIVGSLKLVGCIVARLIYGPQFGELGYIAGDWRTAKLMISTFWGLTAGVSLSLLLADWWTFKRQSIEARQLASQAMPS